MGGRLPRPVGRPRPRHALRRRRRLDGSRVVRVALQLGERHPSGAHEPRGHRGRGGVPQHGAAVLPERHHHRARTAERGGVPLPVGGDQGPQPVAGRLLRAAARAAGGTGPGLRRRPRRRDHRNALGERGRAGGRAHPGRRRRTVRPAIRPVVGRELRSGPPGAPPLDHRHRADDRLRHGCRRGRRARDHVLGRPGGEPPGARRSVPAVPRPEVRDHRDRVLLGAPRAAEARLRDPVREEPGSGARRVRRTRSTGSSCRRPSTSDAIAGSGCRRCGPTSSHCGTRSVSIG